MPGAHILPTTYKYIIYPNLDTAHVEELIPVLNYILAVMETISRSGRTLYKSDNEHANIPSRISSHLPFTRTSQLKGWKNLARLCRSSQRLTHLCLLVPRFIDTFFSTPIPEAEKTFKLPVKKKDSVH